MRINLFDNLRISISGNPGHGRQHEPSASISFTVPPGTGGEQEENRLFGGV
jgi:hypothetical protein